MNKELKLGLILVDVLLFSCGFVAVVNAGLTGNIIDTILEKLIN